jgi:hypothetical protein
MTARVNAAIGVVAEGDEDEPGDLKAA